MSGVIETLSFLRDPDFARSRFERYGDVYGTTLLGQRPVFIRGDKAISDLFAQGDAVQGWWPGECIRGELGQGHQRLLAIAGVAHRPGPLVSSTKATRRRDLVPGGSQTREHILRFEGIS